MQGMLEGLRGVTTADVVSVREVSDRCPSVMWVTSPFLLFAPVGMGSGEGSARSGKPALRGRSTASLAGHSRAGEDGPAGRISLRRACRLAASALLSADIEEIGAVSLPLLHTLTGEDFLLYFNARQAAQEVDGG
jgi:hypothetical protein